MKDKHILNSELTMSLRQRFAPNRQPYDGSSLTNKKLFANTCGDSISYENETLSGTVITNVNYVGKYIFTVQYVYFT